MPVHDDTDLKFIKCSKYQTKK